MLKPGDRVVDKSGGAIAQWRFGEFVQAIDGRPPQAWIKLDGASSPVTVVTATLESWPPDSAQDPKQGHAMNADGTKVGRR